MRPSNTEFYTENALRAHPLAENSTGIDDRGLQMPTGLLVDLAVSVPEPESNELRVSCFGLTRLLASITISSSRGPVLSGTFLRTSAGTTLPLIPLVDGACGFVVFGAAVESADAGIHRFSAVAQSQLSDAVVTVLPAAGVKAIAKKGNSPSLDAQGSIAVEGSGGVLVVNDPTDPSTLVIGLTDAAAKTLGDAVAATSDCPTPPIRSINGVTADAEGRLLIRFL